MYTCVCMYPHKSSRHFMLHKPVTHFVEASFYFFKENKALCLGFVLVLEVTGNVYNPVESRVTRRNTIRFFFKRGHSFPRRATFLFFFNLNVFICYFPNILVKKYFLQIYVQNPCQGT